MPQGRSAYAPAPESRNRFSCKDQPGLLNTSCRCNSSSTRLDSIRSMLFLCQALRFPQLGYFLSQFRLFHEIGLLLCSGQCNHRKRDCPRHIKGTYPSFARHIGNSRSLGTRLTGVQRLGLMNHTPTVNSRFDRSQGLPGALLLRDSCEWRFTGSAL